MPGGSTEINPKSFIIVRSMPGIEIINRITARIESSGGIKNSALNLERSRLLNLAMVLLFIVLIVVYQAHYLYNYEYFNVDKLIKPFIKRDLFVLYYKPDETNLNPSI